MSDTSNALAIRQVQRQPAGWDPTPEQEKMVRDMFLGGAPSNEAAVLMEVAKSRRLNPLLKQIHFVQRWDSLKNGMVWSAQVGIDGFRAIAQRTGNYDGQDEPEFEHDKTGRPLLCRVKVYRKDWSRPAVGIAYFSEYAQTKKDGQLTSMWARGPHFMLAKCAESLALRKAFPEDLSGLYEPAEIGDGDGVPLPASRPEAVTDSKPVPPAPKTSKAAKARADAPPRALQGQSAEAEESKVLARRVRRIREYGQQAGYDATTWATDILLPTLGTERKATQWSAEDCDKLERALGIQDPPENVPTSQPPNVSAKRAVIIDVLDGETEEQAKARIAET